MEELEIFEVMETSDFEKSVKRFVKKKRFFSLAGQIRELKDKVRRGEFEGDKITHQDSPVPYDTYKLRLPIPDINIGKSDGYRLIYMALTRDKVVVFMALYYKKEQPTISDAYINGLIDGYFLASLPEED